MLGLVVSNHRILDGLMGYNGVRLAFQIDDLLCRLTLWYLGIAMKNHNIFTNEIIYSWSVLIYVP